MSTNATKLENLINPEVLADMISAQLENKLRATEFMKVDSTLQGKAGDSVTIPSYVYVGMAEDLGEGVEGTPVKLTSEEKSYSIKKAAKFIELTDEAILSGYGSPMDEATKQLKLSIADKIDYDGAELLNGITSSTGLVYTADGATISYADVIEALDLMELEEQGEKFYLLASRDIAKGIRLDTKFVDRATALGDSVLTSGAVGSIAGAELVISNRIDEGTAFLMKKGAITVFLKRDTQVEKERKSLSKTTLLSADKHYTVAIQDYSRLVKLEVTPETV